MKTTVKLEAQVVSVYENLPVAFQTTTKRVTSYSEPFGQ